MRNANRLLAVPARLSEQIQKGRKDLFAGETETAFTEFATACEERKRRAEGRTAG